MSARTRAREREKKDTDHTAANGTGSGDWAEAYVKARAMVAKMTLEEKVGGLKGAWGNF